MSENKQILIIGGCGYIGSALYKNLQKKYIVTSIDLEWSGYTSINNLNIDYNNLTNSYLSEFDVIILLAGHSSVKMCEDTDGSSFRNNVVNFVNLLSKLNKQKLIYASSCSAYGDMSGEGINEDCNFYIPLNNYDLYKKSIDFHAQLSKIEYYGLRFGTVCGFSPNLRNDIMINAMYDKFVQIGEIMLFNKEVRRPILGINDLIRAVTAIIENNTNQRGVYNLASFNMTAGEIAQNMSAALNCPIKIMTDTKEIINVKLQSATYDFTINSDKFTINFDFSFQENIESIVKSLKDNYDDCMKSGRSYLRPYRNDN